MKIDSFPLFSSIEIILVLGCLKLRSLWFNDDKSRGKQITDVFKREFTLHLKYSMLLKLLLPSAKLVCANCTENKIVGLN